MNTHWTGFYTCKECHKTESLWNHTTTDHKEGEELEGRRNDGEGSCNSGDGTDQRVQSSTFMMMMIKNKWVRYDQKYIVVLMQSNRYSCQNLMRLKVSRQIIGKYSNTKFHEKPSSGSRRVPCGRRQADMMKLTVAFRNFAKAPIMCCCTFDVN
jgi:hypothetical protein